MKKRFAFSFLFVFSFALLTLAMPYMLNMAEKSSANSDSEIGTINYYKADLFDYESSKRSSTGNFLLGEDQIKSDDALFLFNQENYYVNPADYGQEVVPKPGEHNSWISSYKYKVAQGLVENTMNDDGTIKLAKGRVAVSGTQAVTLFQKEDKNTYKGSYAFPFENIGNGYMQYDSSKNHVQVTDEEYDSELLKMDRLDVTSSIGFMPFNKLDTSKGSDENGHYALSGSKNYYFGMKLELPFVMPKGGKVTTYNGSEEDMIFEFSGDDDIWVFVDKKLVLDLGGIHDSVSGTINFATGKVETKGNHFDEATGQYSKTASSVTIDSSYVKSLTVGRHTLQVYFLERGGAVSNCKITFRLQEDKTPVETIAPTQEPMGPTLGPTVDSTKEPSKEATKEPEVIVTNEPGYNNTGGNENDEISEPSIEPTDIIVDVDGGTSVGIGTPETVDSRVEKEIDNSKDLSSNTGLSESTNNSEGNKVEDRGFALFDDATPLGFLPKTGTISEVVFYVVGALLVIVAVAIVVVTVAKKKSGAKKNADDE